MRWILSLVERYPDESFLIIIAYFAFLIIACHIGIKLTNEYSKRL